MNLRKLISLVVALFFVFFTGTFWITIPAYAATSPTLTGASSYSVLGATTVTNTGSTTTTGDVGVSAGTAITGFPPGVAGGNNAVYLHSNDASAIAAQADNLSTYGALDQSCDYNYPSGQDLTLISPLIPGVYCSAGSFLLTGNLTLNGSGVWIFKTVSSLVTSPGSSISGTDACNVWWRVGSSATLDTTTTFIGNILALTSISLNTGATLNGRAMVQTGQVSLDTNTISGPTCATTTAATSTTSYSPSNASAAAPNPPCPTIDPGVIAPLIIDSKRIDADSIYISWGPYSGTNDFIVRYGMTKDNLIYNVDVTGFSTTLNSLPANQPIWVQVAARNECQIGDFETAVQIGKATMTGSPGLPNTGIGGEENNNTWSIIASVVLGLSIILFGRSARKSVSLQ